MPESFDNLREYHDGEGREIVEREWKRLGGVVLKDGMEENRNEISSELRTDFSDPALAIRPC